jgi:hypothetical protein
MARIAELGIDSFFLVPIIDSAIVGSIIDSLTSEKIVSAIAF